MLSGAYEVTYRNTAVVNGRNTNTVELRARRLFNRPSRPIAVPDDPETGSDNWWTPNIGQPVTPRQPDDTDLPYAPQLTEEQHQMLYEQAQEPEVYGHKPQSSTVATDAGTGIEARRINPQTGDESSLIGIILSVAGIVLSLGGVLLLKGKSK